MGLKVGVLCLLLNGFVLSETDPPAGRCKSPILFIHANISPMLNFQISFGKKYLKI